MGFVTVFCPLTTNGAGETALQATGETRFVVDCNVKPASLVGHVRTTLVPAAKMPSCSAPTDASEMLKIVPEPPLPPPSAVPYRVLPDKINPHIGELPSLLV